MRLGKYKVFYNSNLVAKCWSMNKCMELIANMVAIGYDKELFDIQYLNLGLDI